MPKREERGNLQVGQSGPNEPLINLLLVSISSRDLEITILPVETMPLKLLIGFFGYDCMELVFLSFDAVIICFPDYNLQLFISLAY